MTGMSAAIDDYLSVRRALGHKMQLAERLLGQFSSYCEQVGAMQVTIEIAIAWAMLPAEASAGWWAQRLGVVRGFATWLQTQDPCTQVPPADILPGRFGRADPYLYSEADIAAMMAAARNLSVPLQRHTYETLIGLLGVTGMRISEAIRLDRDDVDAARGVLRVVNSKFGKSRQIPLHPSVLEALRRYEDRRNQLCPAPRCGNFFLSTVGTALRYSVVHPTFKKLAGRAGLQPRSQRCRPRIHDLRHSFAVRVLVDCYATDGDVQAVLPLLSTYLGHVDPKSTYWYLSAAPELLSLVSRRLETAFDYDAEDDQ
ncbi:MAG: integrase [Pseudonocardiales bacterium]|nr:MAG: integrase [Pseudonocardiales bacterium]